MHNNDMEQKKDYSRQTVNLDENLVPLVRKRWEAMGFRSFTDYVESLIRSDLSDRPILLRSEDGAVFATAIRQVQAAERPILMVAEPAPEYGRDSRPGKLVKTKTQAKLSPEIKPQTGS